MKNRGGICTYVVSLHVLSILHCLIFKRFQHEFPDDVKAAPVLAPVRMQPMADAKAAVGNLLKRKTVSTVLAERGVLGYWSAFIDDFFGDRSTYLDGSAYFRSVLRKLRRAATKTPQPPPGQPGPAEKPYDPVRQRIKEEIPSSYMPSSVPSQEGSLLAVYLTGDRVNELDLHGFKNFEPLIARVNRVLDSETFECSWLEAQPVKGHEMANGMTDGYNGRWQEWTLENGTIPLSVLKADDIYAANFKLMPATQKMCTSLKKILKRALSIFKGEDDEEDSEDPEDV